MPQDTRRVGDSTAAYCAIIGGMRQLITRIDDDLHARLKARAAAEGRSMNALVQDLLAHELPPESPREWVRRRAEAAGIRIVVPPLPEGPVPTRDEAIAMTRGAGRAGSEGLDWARGKW